MHQLTISYEDDVLWALQKQPEEFESEARRLLAIKLYETGRLSTGLAANLAGVTREAFYYLLGEYGLSTLDADAADLEEDLKNARRASRPQ